MWGRAGVTWESTPGGWIGATVGCVVASWCSSARLTSPRSALAWQLSGPRLHKQTNHAGSYAHRAAPGSCNGTMWCTCTASVVMRPAARHSRHSPPSRWRISARVRCHLAVLRIRAAASALGALAGRCGHAWPRWCRPPHHLQDTSTSTTPNNKKGTVRPMWAACSCRDSIIPHKKVAQSQILGKIKGPANDPPGLMWFYFVLSRCIRSAQACKM